MEKKLSYYIGWPLPVFALSYEKGRALVNWLSKHLIDFNVTGTENIPKKESAIIAANHESWLDTILLPIKIKERNLHYVAKKELWESEGLYGKFLKRQMDRWYAMPVNREKPTIEQIKRFKGALKEGHIISIFPEGTRQRRLGEFHDLVAYMAYGTGTPVIPTGIIGTKDAEPYIFNSPPKPHIEINFGEPIYFEKVPGEDKKEAFRKFNEKLKKKMGALMGLEDIVQSD